MIVINSFQSLFFFYSFRFISLAHLIVFAVYGFHIRNNLFNGNAKSICGFRAQHNIMRHRMLTKFCLARWRNFTNRCRGNESVFSSHHITMDRYIIDHFRCSFFALLNRNDIINFAFYSIVLRFNWFICGVWYNVLEYCISMIWMEMQYFYFVIQFQLLTAQFQWFQMMDHFKFNT